MKNIKYPEEILEKYHEYLYRKQFKALQDKLIKGVKKAFKDSRKEKNVR